MLQAIEDAQRLDFLDLPVTPSRGWIDVPDCLDKCFKRPDEQVSAVNVEDLVYNRAKGEYKLRRARDRAFDGTFFADPAWDILLDLFISETEGRITRISSACLASCAPLTTGLRYLSMLVEKGLVVRWNGERDNRVTNVKLSSDAEALMRSLFAS